jgi:hypothetical protein
LCLDSKGEVLWRRPTRGAAASTISAGDLDLDGRADICLITQAGVIYRFDESGQRIWEIDMQGRLTRSDYGTLDAALARLRGQDTIIRRSSAWNSDSTRRISARSDSFGIPPDSKSTWR